MLYLEERTVLKTKATLILHFSMLDLPVLPLLDTETSKTTFQTQNHRNHTLRQARLYLSTLFGRAATGGTPGAAAGGAVTVPPGATVTDARRPRLFLWLPWQVLVVKTLS